MHTDDRIETLLWKLTSITNQCFSPNRRSWHQRPTRGSHGLNQASQHLRVCVRTWMRTPVNPQVPLHRAWQPWLCVCRCLLGAASENPWERKFRNPASITEHLQTLLHLASAGQSPSPPPLRDRSFHQRYWKLEFKEEGCFRIKWPSMSFWQDPKAQVWLALHSWVSASWDWGVATTTSARFLCNEVSYQLLGGGGRKHRAPLFPSRCCSILKVEFHLVLTSWMSQFAGKLGSFCKEGNLAMVEAEYLNGNQLLAHIN